MASFAVFKSNFWLFDGNCVFADFAVLIRLTLLLLCLFPLYRITLDLIVPDQSVIHLTSTGKYTE